MFSRIRTAWRRSRAVTAFAFDGTRVRVVKGKATNASVRELQRILADSSLESCEVHLTGNGRVEFEGAVPRRIQQSIRNVIVR